MKRIIFMRCRCRTSYRWALSWVIALGLINELSAQPFEFEAFDAPGPNVAHGRPYVLEPKPNYAFCTDEGDRTDLTDGRMASEGPLLWTNKKAVGWVNAKVANITIDLGQSRFIGGLSFSTAAGPWAGVTWPVAILILVSDDGEHFHYADELRYLAWRHSVLPSAGRYVFRTDQLRTRGRFVRLSVAASGAYVMCDEIEVYEGTDQTRMRAKDTLVDDPGAFVTQHSTALGLRERIAGDCARARMAVNGAKLAEDSRDALLAELAEIELANRELLKLPEDFRAIFPLSPAHARVFTVVARLRTAGGYPRFFLWTLNRWVPLSLWQLPETPALPPGLNVRMMDNEIRADVLNVANFSDGPREARVWVEGLPGGPVPKYVSMRSAEYVAMQSGDFQADALPVATQDDRSWSITLPSGVSRQLWVSFGPEHLPEPGTYFGRVVVQIDGTPDLKAPVKLCVESFRLPDEPTLTLSMWDYTSGSLYGIQDGNVTAAIKHLRSYGYNAPWGATHVLPRPGADHFDDEDHLVRPLDHTVFDRWVARWPDARYYMVFAWVGDEFAGAAAGSERFNRRLGRTMRAWADHARELGIEPSRLALLLVDEPKDETADRRIVHWARPIKAAVPAILIFENPNHPAPQEAVVQEMFQSCDILCPQTWQYLAGGRPLADFYERLRAAGRQLWFYSCGGGPSSKDVISYYRNQQWECWNAGATGTCFWSFADIGPRRSAWNALQIDVNKIGGEIFSPVYLDSTSVTDGKHWLAIIEGIEDYEYLKMLSDHVAQFEDTGESSGALDWAKHLLATLPKQVTAAARQGDREVCDQARLRVLDALVELDLDKVAGG